MWSQISKIGVIYKKFGAGSGCLTDGVCLNWRLPIGPKVFQQNFSKSRRAAEIFSGRSDFGEIFSIFISKSEEKSDILLFDAADYSTASLGFFDFVEQPQQHKEHSLYNFLMERIFVSPFLSQSTHSLFMEGILRTRQYSHRTERTIF